MSLGKNRFYQSIRTLIVIVVILTTIYTVQSMYHAQLSSKSTKLDNIGDNSFSDLSILDNEITTESSSTDFISTWNTAITYIGSTGDLYLKLPLESSGTYNFVVDWGDGSSDMITQYDQIETSHLYSVSGVYTLTISGTIIGWSFGDSGDNRKLIEISQWGNLTLGNSGGYFDGCENLVLTATDAPDLTGTTSLYAAFRYTNHLGNSGSMETWDVSEVTDMSFMFYQASTFNMSLATWNVGKVTTMESMFAQTDDYNQPMNSWNVSNVTTMASMFYQAYSFNQPINSWDVSSVTNMYSIFQWASEFNQDLSDWDVSSVLDMRNVFNNAASFNKSINTWNTSRVTNMAQMFWGATSFNQPLNQLNVSSVVSMYRMFYHAWNFNQPLNSWDVSSVTSMGSMFYNATAFNQPLDDWDVSSVTDTQSMFYLATSFDQNIGMWNVENCQYMSQMFRYATLHPRNYDALLIGWSQLSLKTGVYFHGGFSQFLSEAKAARSVLTDTFSWNIVDGGLTVIPEVTQPADINYIEGETGNIIVWSVGSSNPDLYNTTLDGSILTETQSWTNGTITQNVDGLSAGVYEVILYLYDTNGKMNFDKIIVTVFEAPDTIPPEISSPLDAEYTVGTTDLTITWTVGDANPGTYNVTRNGTLFQASQPWTNGTLTLEITGLNVGIYNFTIYLYDMSGDKASDTVMITITEIQTSTTTSISSTSSRTSTTTSTTSTSSSTSTTTSTTSTSSSTSTEGETSVVSDSPILLYSILLGFLAVPIIIRFRWREN